jgi:hypothetical protein
MMCSEGKVWEDKVWEGDSIGREDGVTQVFVLCGSRPKWAFNSEFGTLHMKHTHTHESTPLGKCEMT